MSVKMQGGIIQTVSKGQHISETEITKTLMKPEM